MQRLAVATFVALSCAACGGPSAPAQRPAPDTLESALQPAHAVAALKQLGGAHFRGTSRFRLSANGDTTAQALSTTTDVWIDRSGHYRLVENNDQDGGREVMLFGRELAVALKYGKMIRRPAQEPEPTRLLEEALGAPWAAWETVRREAAVEATGAPGLYRISKRAEAAPPPGPATPLRQWRDTVAVQALSGEARLDPKTGALLGFKLATRFTARRGKLPLAGEITVETQIDGVGRTPAINRPVTEELTARQRTILEEKALLGDLGGAPGPAR